MSAAEKFDEENNATPDILIRSQDLKKFIKQYQLNMNKMTSIKKEIIKEVKSVKITLNKYEININNKLKFQQYTILSIGLISFLSLCFSVYITISDNKISFNGDIAEQSNTNRSVIEQKDMQMESINRTPSDRGCIDRGKLEDYIDNQKECVNRSVPL